MIKRYGQEILPPTPDQVDELMDAVAALEPRNNDLRHGWGSSLPLEPDETFDPVARHIVELPCNEAAVTRTTYDIGFSVRAGLEGFRLRPRPWERVLSIAVGRRQEFGLGFVLCTSAEYEVYTAPKLSSQFRLRRLPFRVSTIQDEMLYTGIHYGDQQDPDLARALKVLQQDKIERDQRSMVQQNMHAARAGRVLGEMNRAGVTNASRLECAALTGVIAQLRPAV